ncbi:hypothetical protein KFL_001540180 [Klebsormidium nitens]|uniref:Uncharacterized protein n=1 Tax=Klebsormidium nitens TaxID=105231 RepID=A0A1Y1HY49_KLENI|nr:hypothetical protein KFL_001540180 [Klebsormidium nitens]|eukprot:GAQ83600.1 hypothetical protein KFL_001540180 [Klebsormidium nitens]
MEGFLQHVRSLRMQISEYEDKAAEISARKQQEQTEITSIQRDLDRISWEIKECSQTTEKLLNDSGTIGRTILAAQQEQLQADLDVASLDQAIELMKTGLEADAIKQRSKEQELDTAYDGMLSQLEDYKIDEVIENLTSNVSESDGGNTALADSSKELQDQLRRARSEQARATGEKASVEKQLQDLEEDARTLEEQMKEVNVDVIEVIRQIDGLPDHVRMFASDDQTAALLEEMEGVAEDKGQEKQYAADCRQRLEVLQADQVLDCPSCGHQYELKAAARPLCTAAEANDEQLVTPMED